MDLPVKDDPILAEIQMAISGVTFHVLCGKHTVCIAQLGSLISIPLFLITNLKKRHARRAPRVIVLAGKIPVKEKIEVPPNCFFESSGRF
jgi:hypothetical protein